MLIPWRVLGFYLAGLCGYIFGFLDQDVDMIFPSKIGSQRISMLKFWVEEPRKLIATKADGFC